MSIHGVAKKLTAPALLARKSRGERLVMVTAYDASFARLLDEAGVDVILVGDSLGMVVQGLASTLPVTLEEMTYHAKAVARVVQHAHVVVDLPFMSYQASVEDGLRAAGALVKYGGAESVKVEGGVEAAELVARTVRMGIPVMGHVGLTPQSMHHLGGFKVQGRSQAEAQRVMEGARALADAGAYAIVLECVPTDLGRRITQEIRIPTIGIGAGAGCDGQVLVMHDLLGLTSGKLPRFVRQYANLGGQVREAVQRFAEDVRSGQFPDANESYAVETQGTT